MLSCQFVTARRPSDLPWRNLNYIKKKEPQLFLNDLAPLLRMARTLSWRAASPTPYPKTPPPIHGFRKVCSVPYLLALVGKGRMGMEDNVKREGETREGCEMGEGNGGRRLERKGEWEGVLEGKRKVLSKLGIKEREGTKVWREGKRREEGEREVENGNDTYFSSPEIVL